MSTQIVLVDPGSRSDVQHVSNLIAASVSAGLRRIRCTLDSQPAVRSLAKQLRLDGAAATAGMAAHMAPQRALPWRRRRLRLLGQVPAAGAALLWASGALAAALFGSCTRALCRRCRRRRRRLHLVGCGVAATVVVVNHRCSGRCRCRCTAAAGSAVWVCCNVRNIEPCSRSLGRSLHHSSMLLAHWHARRSTSILACWLGSRCRRPCLSCLLSIPCS